MTSMSGLRACLPLSLSSCRRQASVDTSRWCQRCRVSVAHLNSCHVQRSDISHADSFRVQRLLVLPPPHFLLPFSAFFGLEEAFGSARDGFNAKNRCPGMVSVSKADLDDTVFWRSEAWEEKWEEEEEETLFLLSCRFRPSSAWKRPAGVLDMDSARKIGADRSSAIAFLRCEA